jgi:hypothetical protein
MGPYLRFNIQNYGKKMKLEELIDGVKTGGWFSLSLSCGCCKLAVVPSVTDWSACGDDKIILPAGMKYRNYFHENLN